MEAIELMRLRENVRYGARGDNNSRTASGLVVCDWVADRTMKQAEDARRIGRIYEPLEQETVATEQTKSIKRNVERIFLLSKKRNARIT